MSIESKLKEYCKSEACAEKVMQYVQKKAGSSDKEELRKSGIMNKSAVGSIADKLTEYIVKAGTSAVGDAPSVVDAINSLSHGVINFDAKELSGSFELSFKDSMLHRDSLYNTKCGSEPGVDNIVALFNNGYTIKDPEHKRYGKWVGHSPSTDSAKWRSKKLSENDSYIGARESRDALRFMQKGIDDFMTAFGKNFNIDIVLNSVYEGGPDDAGEE